MAISGILLDVFYFDKDQDGTKCYVCKGKSVLGWGKDNKYMIECLECHKCQTAPYDEPMQAIEAWDNKILI